MQCSAKKINKTYQAALGRHSGSVISCQRMDSTHGLQLLHKDRISEPKGTALSTLTGAVQHPALQTISQGRNPGLRGLVMFICATLHGILISNCVHLKPLNGHTGAVVQPGFCVSTLSKKSCLRTSAGG